MRETNQPEMADQCIPKATGYIMLEQRPFVNCAVTVMVLHLFLSNNLLNELEILEILYNHLDTLKYINPEGITSYYRNHKYGYSKVIKVELTLGLAKTSLD